MSAIRTVGVVGAGTMGRRIAFGCAASGIASRLYDITPGVAGHAVEWVRERLDI
jgi:3-hydroxyacyl-CoA dehydrogenase